jgi:hypothetical protein
MNSGETIQQKTLSRRQLETMSIAGDQILECYRVLRKTKSNVVAEVLRNQGEFYNLDHYPKGDVYDWDTHSQFYYHSHRENEHGHFHTFLREKGMPKNCKPIDQSEADYMTKRDDALSHLIAISMDRAGYPTRIFTTNRWVTADNWYTAQDVIKMLDCFEMDLAWPSWPLNIWITAMIRLFRPQIEDLITQRNAMIDDLQGEANDQDVFEDRQHAIVSTMNISVEDQIFQVKHALMNAA